MKTVHKSSERGQVLILIVVGLVVLIGATALVVDGGNVFVDRRQAQNAVDSAALASALARIRGQDFVVAAYKSAAKNGYNNDKVTNSIEVFSPPISGAHVDDIDYIQIILTSNVQTYFAGVIGRDVIVNQVSATARTKTPEIAELLKGYALIALAPESNCENKRSFWVHGEATIDITGGGIFINSNNRTCALIVHGSGSIRIRDNSLITIVGGASIQKPQLITPYPPKTGSTPMPYPPPFFLPKVGCDQEAEIIVPEVTEAEGAEGESTESTTPPQEAQGTTMKPGSWEDSDFPPPGVTYLTKGTYCVNNFILRGQSLIGNNVTILVKGEVDWDGGATVDLSAPKNGPNAGLLIYLPIDNHNRVRLNGNAGTNGTILAPASPIVLKGNSASYGFHSQIIGYTINVDGQDNMIIKYVDSQNYDAMEMPEIELSE